MAEMKVQDKGPLTVPAHLDGVVAVGNGPRIKAKLLDGAFGLVVYTLPQLLTAVAFSSGDIGVLGVATGLSTLLPLVWVGVLLVMLGTRGQTPGLALAGIRWVKFSTGAQGGANALGKYFLEGLIGGITLGIGSLIIWFSSQDEANRHWYDRTAGIISISTREGRDPSVESAPRRLTSTVTDAPLPVQQPWDAARPVVAEVPAVQTGSSMPPVPLPPAQGLGAGGPLPVSGGLMPPVPPPPGTTQQEPSLHVASPTSAPEPVGSAGPGTGTFIGEVPWAPPSSSPAGTAPVAPLTSTPVQPAEALPEVPAWILDEPAAAPAARPAAVGAPGTIGAVPASVPAPVEDLERTVARRPAGSLRLTFDDGTQHHLVGTGLVGRDPAPDAAHSGAERIPLHDPARSISKTHLALTVQSGAVLVEDLHSTNGTRVEGPEGSSTSVLPGAPLLASVGSTIHFGDRSVVIGG